MKMKNAAPRDQEERITSKRTVINKKNRKHLLKVHV